MLIIFNIAFVLTAMSQQKRSEFLFKDYQEATIYFFGNFVSKEKVNYNVMARELYYIDRIDGEEKIVSNSEDIRIIKTDNRTFILVKGRLQEVLPTTPPIYVEYLPKVQTKAQNAGYGSTSHTSAITSYSMGQQGVLVHESKELETTGFSNFYWIERSGDKKKFTNFNQFLKIYSKHKKVLDEHIKTNKIDFNDIEEIINLCLYAESLN